MGASDVSALKEVGELLAALKERRRFGTPRRARANLVSSKARCGHGTARVRGAPCQAIVWEGTDVDLGKLPIQTCWPEDAGPLITWGLVMTRGPHITPKLVSTGNRCNCE